MFHRFRIAAGLTAVIVLLPGCTLLSAPLHLWPWKNKKPPRATLQVDQVMGTIAMVNEESSFVLVDSGSLPSPPVGAILKVRSADASPVALRVTQVRKPPFFVADIVKGTPKKGDQVYQ